MTSRRPHVAGRIPQIRTHEGQRDAKLVVDDLGALCRNNSMTGHPMADTALRNLRCTRNVNLLDALHNEMITELHAGMFTQTKHAPQSKISSNAVLRFCADCYLRL